MEWATKSLMATVGAGILGMGVAVFIANVVRSARGGLRAGPDPWSSDTLEWSASSPPPAYNFLFPPTVRHRYPIWSDPGGSRLVVGLPTDSRQVLVTRLVDADPDHRMTIAGPTVWPFWVAVGVAVTFIGLIFTPWAAPIGLVLTAVPLIGWFWPTPPHHELLQGQP
jgi:hypothetical protein